jgi:type III restriction enzyme
VNKVSYELREVKVKTSLTDAKGGLYKTIPVSLCGKEMHAIHNATVQVRSLYEDAFMPVDSQIERDTVDESNRQDITVFAKLPKIDIPTPAGKYNPDFGYAIAQDGVTQALYLVVETKGYDSQTDISIKEKWKINSAKQFFKALQELPELKNKGVKIHFQPKINGEKLEQLISSII